MARVQTCLSHCNSNSNEISKDKITKPCYINNTFLELEKIFTFFATIKSRSEYISVSKHGSWGIDWAPFGPLTHDTWQWYWKNKSKNPDIFFYLTIENKTYDQQFGTFPEKLSNFRPFYDIVYQLVQFQSCQQKNSNQIYNQLKSYFQRGWVCECLLFNAKWAIFQIYHGKNKLYFDEVMVPDQHA